MDSVNNYPTISKIFTLALKPAHMEAFFILLGRFVGELFLRCPWFLYRLVEYVEIADRCLHRFTTKGMHLLLPNSTGTIVNVTYAREWFI